VGFFLILEMCGNNMADTDITFQCSLEFFFFSGIFFYVILSLFWEPKSAFSVSRLDRVVFPVKKGGP
jgi:hypothetical protein